MYVSKTELPAFADDDDAVAGATKKQGYLLLRWEDANRDVKHVLISK